MQVGVTKDQGLYNKPSAAVHPGALAAGTLPQYNTFCGNPRLDYVYICYKIIVRLTVVCHLVLTLTAADRNYRSKK